MARGSDTSNRVLVRGAARAMDQFKYEVARNIGIDQTRIQNGYWGELSSRDCGAVGGQMVRQMIRLAEQQIAGGTVPPAGGAIGGGAAGGAAGGGGFAGGGGAAGGGGYAGGGGAAGGGMTR